MRTGHGCRTGLTALALGLALACPALAKLPAEPARQPQAQNASRVTEIMIELAWLADPITFPFYLQARMQDPALHVRGFVPSAAVREQALRLARLRCPMNVIDELSLRPGLAVPSAIISPSHLEKSALASLGVALPGMRFLIAADRAGKIKVEGQVHSFEEKLLVSQGLRRLHGCTAVINQVHVVEAGQAPGNIVAAGSQHEMKAASLTSPVPTEQPKPKAKSAPLATMGPALPEQPKAESPALVKSNEPDRGSPAASTEHEMEAASATGPVLPDQPEPTSPPLVNSTAGPQWSPPVPADETNTADRSAGKNWNVGPAWEETAEQSSPLLITRGTVFVMDESTPPAAADPTKQLKEIIASSCGIPDRNIQVQFKSARDVEIRIQANNQEEANTLALHIFQLPELLPYRLDVQATIPK
jgi:hypothetical protein